MPFDAPKMIPPNPPKSPIWHGVVLPIALTALWCFAVYRDAMKQYESFILIGFSLVGLGAAVMFFRKLAGKS